MKRHTCNFADPIKRGSRSPECFPSAEIAQYIVRNYFIDPVTRRRSPLYLCRAHAEYHLHLGPERLAARTSELIEAR